MLIVLLYKILSVFAVLIKLPLEDDIMLLPLEDDDG